MPSIHFSSQYWQRDLVSETQSDEPWHAFVEQMNQVGFPQLPEIDIKLGSASLWMRAIRGLKSGKAEGIDGWRCDEIKKLPETCISDLAAILARGARFGLSKSLMAAKTTLLAKIPDPKSLHHIRPITILGVIYIPSHWTGDFKTCFSSLEDDNAFTDIWRIARSWRKGHSLPSQTPDRTCNPKQSPVGRFHIGPEEGFQYIP